MRKTRKQHIDYTIRKIKKEYTHNSLRSQHEDFKKKFKYIGSGANGFVYDIGYGVAMKITEDRPFEYSSYLKVKRLNSKYFVKYYKFHKVGDFVLIFMEKLVSNREYLDKCNMLSSLFFFYDTEHKMKLSYKDDPWYINNFKRLREVAPLLVKLNASDVKPENSGQDRFGNIKIFDLIL